MASFLHSPAPALGRTNVKPSDAGYSPRSGVITVSSSPTAYDRLNLQELWGAFTGSRKDYPLVRKLFKGLQVLTHPVMLKAVYNGISLLLHA